MRTTASYELFPDAPSERAMARARYLVREGRIADAEKAYRNLLAEHPDLKPGWAECFELLRAQGRGEDALRVAEGSCGMPGATRPRKWRTREPPRPRSTGSSASRRSARSPLPGATRSTPRA